MIEPWRNIPRTAPHQAGTGIEGDATAANPPVFPSGRQAVTKSLQLMSLSRPDRVAMPEFSSHCVISAIGRRSTPMPIADAVAADLPVKGLLLYEQWGWYFPAGVVERGLDTSSKLVLDCVDSPDAPHRYAALTETAPNMVCLVVSLSKCLGLKGGGLLFHGGTPVDPDLAESTEDRQWDVTLNGLSADLVKTYARTNRHIAAWLAENDVLQALAAEAEVRRANLQVLASSSLSSGWEPWMLEAVGAGCSAGIAPLLRGMAEDQLQASKRHIAQATGYIPEVYNFNWTGNPFDSKYERCLAFPSHGQVQMADLLDTLIETRRLVSSGDRLVAMP